MHRNPLQELVTQNGRIVGLTIKEDALNLESCSTGPEISSPNVGYTQANKTSAQSAPKTPLKHSSKPGTPPLTPLANLKVLIAAASTAREKEGCVGSGRWPEGGGGVVPLETTLEAKGEGEKGVKEMEDGGGRKMRSLAVLCKKFLSIAESDIGVGTDFSLESMSNKLGTNRRRIYDIINVLEALEMIVKQSKNWYTWLGQENLLFTLAKMRAMAEDDADFRSLLHKENGTDLTKEPPLPAPSGSAAPPGGEEPGFCVAEDGSVGGVGGGRWDKSLGVLCQKFIMLFLVTPDNEVTLDFAGNILMPDDGSFSPQPANPKTKVRRLYDIANVLTTLGLIRKKTFLAPNHRKMPGYSWAGPSLQEIQTISVSRKSEFNLYPFYPKKKGAFGGVALTRKPSSGSMRPFLHQYEVKGQGRAASCGPNSAPSSPVKGKGSAGFKRSLSFGAGRSKKIPPKAPALPSSRPVPPLQMVTDTKERTVSTSSAMPTYHMSSTGSKCVVARQLSPVQVNYLQEVREFEAEIQRHAHKYPHVAPVFSEFVNKFQSVLEQAAANAHSAPSPKLDATPSPPFNVSPAEFASKIFSLSSGGYVTTTSSVASSVAGGTPPSSIPGSGSATPSQIATPPAPMLTQSPSPRSKFNKFACVEIATGRPGSVSIQTRPTPYSDSGSFNPNSLLVSTNGARSFLPCYPVNTGPGPSPGPVAVPIPAPMAGGKGGTIRSLAPKPLSEERHSAQENKDCSPPKRACFSPTLTN